MPATEQRHGWKHGLAIFLLLLGIRIANAEESPNISAAKQVVSQWLQLQHAYNPAVSDLFTAQAEMTIHVVDANGNEQKVAIKGEQLHRILKLGVQGNKQNGVKTKLDDIKYKEEPNGVRVTATDVTPGQVKPGKIEWLITPQPGERWQIVEAHTWIYQ